MSDVTSAEATTDTRYPFVLVCRTNDRRDEGCDYAMVVVTKKLVDELLHLQNVYRTAKKLVPSLYGLEVYDDVAEWGGVIKGFEPNVHRDEASLHWHLAGSFRSAEEIDFEPSEYSTRGDVIKAVGDGVYWSAHYKYADPEVYFETPVLTWEAIEKLASGVTPGSVFRTAAVEGYEEEERWYRNYYECPGCHHRWEEVYDGKVDDECPACDADSITPYKSEEVEP